MLLPLLLPMPFPELVDPLGAPGLEPGGNAEPFIMPPLLVPLGSVVLVAATTGTDSTQVNPARANARLRELFMKEPLVVFSSVAWVSVYKPHRIGK
jgi:glycerol uptake facilitator-like aquaporin